MRGFRVWFKNADKVVNARAGENLFFLARRTGVHIDSTCGGGGTCHQCRVKVHAGNFPEKMIASDPARFLEPDGKPVTPHDEQDGEPVYLSCRGCVMGDLVIETAPRLHQARTLVRKTLLNREIPIDRPDLPTDAFVAAVDMGSTTIAGYLISLAEGKVVAQTSRENSQIPYGGDILNRVSHTERAADGLQTLSALARKDLDEVLAALAKRAGAPIASVSVCGNSVIQSLLMGWDVLELGREPFEPVSTNAQKVTGRDLNLASHPDTEVFVFPLVAGFIGGDHAACVLAHRLHEADDPTMLVDIGTNGEIVLGSRDGLIAASTPTGPAFEGGEIKFGMRAARGAIDSVDFPPAAVRPSVSVIGNIEPQGICGSGVIATTSALYRGGIADRDGRLLETPFTRTGDDGVREVLLIGPEQGALTPSGNVIHAPHDITFTQKDLREVQLAKAALRTGADILVDRLGRAPTRIVLAGGFGSYIDLDDAATLGLLPATEGEIEVAGNSAGLGACLVAASLTARDEIQTIARGIEHVVLPDDQSFQDRLLANIAYP